MTTTALVTDETTALIAAITTDPDDATAAGALRDYYREHDCTELAATRRVNAIVREAREARILRTARELITSDSARAKRIRAAAKRITNLTGRHPTFVVVAGHLPPTRSGEEAHHTFRKGGRCEYPSAALRAGYKVDYQPSTLTITAGANWVCAQK